MLTSSAKGIQQVPVLYEYRSVVGQTQETRSVRFPGYKGENQIKARLLICRLKDENPISTPAAPAGPAIQQTPSPELSIGRGHDCFRGSALVASLSWQVPHYPDYLGFFEDLSTQIRKKRPNRKTNVVVIMYVFKVLNYKSVQTKVNVYFQYQ